MADEYFSSWSAGISEYLFMAGILRVAIRLKSKQWYEISPHNLLRGAYEVNEGVGFCNCE
jgi:hypothetical protein